MTGYLNPLWGAPLASFWEAWWTNAIEPPPSLFQLCGWPNHPFKAFFDSVVRDYMEFAGITPITGRTMEAETQKLNGLIDSQKDTIRDLNKEIANQKSFAVEQQKEITKQKKRISELLNRIQEKSDSAKELSESAKAHAARIAGLEAEILKKNRELDQLRQAVSIPEKERPPQTSRKMKDA